MPRKSSNWVLPGTIFGKCCAPTSRSAGSRNRDQQPSARGDRHRSDVRGGCSSRHHHRCTPGRCTGRNCRRRRDHKSCSGWCSARSSPAADSDKYTRPKARTACNVIDAAEAVRCVTEAIQRRPATTVRGGWWHVPTEFGGQRHEQDTVRRPTSRSQRVRSTHEVSAVLQG
jgi:hypothetical protein